MRIGVLTTSYPREDGDPAGGFVAGFARWLAANLGDVEVLCAAGDRELFYRGGAPQALGGLRWFEAAAFSTELFARAVAKASAWDAVVSHWLVPSSAVGALVAGRRPHLAIAHGSDVRLLARLPGGAAFARQLAARADLVYVARALAVDGAPGRVVPMGVDVEAFRGGARDSERARLNLDGFAILYIGRLSREKGVDLLLAALPDGATLLIAGDGPERASLERAARERGFASDPPRVRFLGEVRGAARRDLFAACDALAVPSREDGAPTVIREALAAGLPVIATRVGGVPELVTDGETALLCDPDPSGIRTALVRLSDDSHLRKKLAGAGSRIASTYDWSAVGPVLAKALGHAKPNAPGTISITRF
ncbi:MAG TPA: glycosyltransferase [Polyangia bacterium]|nr:glycosyltransferase [Polyangia bacterium]